MGFIGSPRRPAAISSASRRGSIDAAVRLPRLAGGHPHGNESYIKAASEKRGKLLDIKRKSICRGCREAAQRRNADPSSAGPRSGSPNRVREKAEAGLLGDQNGRRSNAALRNSPARDRPAFGQRLRFGLSGLGCLQLGGRL